MGNKSVDVVEEIILTDGDEITVSGDVEINADVEEIQSVLAEIETDEIRAEAYAEQPAAETGEALSEEDVAPKGKGMRQKTPKAPKAPKPERLSLLTHKASEIIAESIARMGMAMTLNADGTTLGAQHLEAVDKLDRKTREKAVNLIQSVASNKLPSVYTRQAVKAFNAYSGVMTLKELVAYYLEVGYQPGTARRQASEMFALFPALGMATRGEGKGAALTLNPGSTLVAYIAEGPSKTEESAAAAA